MANKKEETSDHPTKAVAKQNPMKAAVAIINNLRPDKIMEDIHVKNRILSMYVNAHGLENGENIYAVEKFHFGKLLQENPKLLKCTPMSLYGCLVDAATQQVTLDPRKKQGYLIPRNVNIGTKQKPVYELRCFLEIDGRGELLIRERAGQIKHAETPTLVYEGDTFIPGADKYGKKILVKYEKAVPRKSNNIIAVFMAVEKPDGTVEFIYFDRERVNEWRAASQQPNSPAWTTGLAGMIETKCIKHGLKTFPPVPIRGTHTILKTQEPETQDIDYGFVDEETGEVKQIESKEEQPEVYGEQPEDKAEENGVSAPVDDDEADTY